MMAEYRTASGRVLTDNDIDVLVEEAERGYDLRQLTPRPPSAMSARSRRYRKMVQRRGWLWARNWFFLAPTPVKPSKRGRRG